MDPFTREVKPDKPTVEFIRGYVSSFDRIIYHNSKFDIRALKTIGIDLSNKPFEDTLIASHVVSSADNHGLKELALKYFDYSDLDEKHLHKQVLLACHKARQLGWKLAYNVKGEREPSWDYWVPGELDPNDKSCEDYGCKDVERTILLWNTYENLLQEEGLWEQYQRELKLVPIILDIESKGISVNLGKLTPTKEYLREEGLRSANKARSIVRIRDKGLFNIDSSKDLCKVLHTSEKGFKLPVVKRTEAGGISTDKEALNKLYNDLEEDDPACKFIYNLLYYKAFNSAIKYLESYERLSHKINDDWGILYPSLNQTGTRTTRCSSSNPNGQNIGKKDEFEIGTGEDKEVFKIPKLRDVFSPLPGKVWYAIDYSQLELRIFAYLSKEQSLIDRLESGEDIFKFITSRVLGIPESKVQKPMRQKFKNATYATIYGATEAKIDRTCGFKGAYKTYCSQFPNVGEFMTSTINEVKKYGYIKTMDGYRLDAPKNAAYKGLNYKIQGTAGRIAKDAMYRISCLDSYRSGGIRMVFQIHDEIIVETDLDGRFDTGTNIYDVMDCMRISGESVGINTPVTCARITTDWGHGVEVAVSDDGIFPLED